MMSRQSYFFKVVICDWIFLYSYNKDNLIDEFALLHDYKFDVKFFNI